MIHEIIFKEEALQDVGDSYEFYETRKERLGEQFLSELESILSSIQKHPTSFPKVIRNLRKVSMNRFPFAVIYEFEHNSIVVYAVYHGKKNPKGKFRRK